MADSNRRGGWAGAAVLAAFAGLVLLRLRRLASRTRVRGRVVIVTGASSGIGAATARAFAAAAARLVLVARRAERLEALAADLRANGTEVLVVPADVTRDDDLEQIVSEALAAFERIDILVNNAGVRAGGVFEAVSDVNLGRMLDVNLYGPLRLTQLVLPGMKARRFGHIVNISSASDHAPAAGNTVYGATKAGLTHASISLCRELVGTGVRVTVIRPGFAYTEMIDNDDALRQMPGMWMGAVNVTTAEAVAADILRAVRRNRSNVQLGGWGWRAMELANVLAPWLADLYFRVFYPPRRITRIMRELDR